MNTSDLRKLSIEDLKKEQLKAVREKFNLRMEKFSKETSRPNKIKLARRELARIKTILTEKEGKKS